MKKREPFNNPFATLKLLAKRKPVPARPAPAPPRPAPVDERALFRAAVGEVEPLRKGPPLAERRPTPPRVRVQSEDDLVREQLSLMVAGQGPFELTDSDEFVQGAVQGLDPTLLEKLRRGGFAVQRHLDLHGLTRSEAKAALEAFIQAARRDGLRCVLVVHGRGLHSKDQLPVLKQSLQGWLSRGSIGRQVLAFCTARPHDGGAGAVYVLLRAR
jgi:DNA-nicking Smr family endonuclease